MWEKMVSLDGLFTVFFSHIQPFQLRTVARCCQKIPEENKSTINDHDLKQPQFVHFHILHISPLCLLVNMFNAYILHTDTTIKAWPTLDIDFRKNLHPCGSFHKWGGPPMAGWFSSGNILSRNGWELGVPTFMETLIYVQKKTHHAAFTCRFTQQILYILGPLIACGVLLDSSRSYLHQAFQISTNCPKSQEKLKKHENNFRMNTSVGDMSPIVGWCSIIVKLRYLPKKSNTWIVHLTSSITIASKQTFETYEPLDTFQLHVTTKIGPRYI